MLVLEPPLGQRRVQATRSKWKSRSLTLHCTSYTTQTDEGYLQGTLHFFCPADPLSATKWHCQSVGKWKPCSLSLNVCNRFFFSVSAWFQLCKSTVVTWYIPNHDASTGVIESCSFRLNALGYPVNAGMTIDGNAIDKPRSKSRKFFTVLATI